MKQERLLYLAAIVVCVAMILMTVVFVVVRMTTPTSAASRIVIVQKEAKDPDAKKLTPPGYDVDPVRINISTRGEESFQQVGVLYSNEDKNHVLPLYGRPTYVGSQKWNYYTTTDGFQSIQLGLQQRDHDCLDMIGCTQFDNGDQLHIPELGDAAFKVRMYQSNVPRYLPWV